MSLRFGYNLYCPFHDGNDIVSWLVDFPDRKVLEISDSSFGVTGSRNTDRLTTEVTREKATMRDRRVNFFG